MLSGVSCTGLCKVFCRSHKKCVSMEKSLKREESVLGDNRWDYLPLVSLCKKVRPSVFVLHWNVYIVPMNHFLMPVCVYRCSTDMAPHCSLLLSTSVLCSVLCVFGCVCRRWYNNHIIMHSAWSNKALCVCSFFPSLGKVNVFYS